jgi:hypothetical protein
MKNTPWGIVEHEQKLAEGVISYMTGSHGGIWLSSERQKELGYDRNYLNSAAWWEEDEDWAVPFAFFCQEIWEHCKKPGFEKMMRAALSVIKWKHPDMLPIVKEKYNAYLRSKKNNSPKESSSCQESKQVRWLLRVKAGGTA